MKSRAWNTDCRFFEGDRPCIHRRECVGCEVYEPMGRRVLILKIGALGDVLRTTPLLEALGNAHVTWVVGDGARPLLHGHPRIHRLWTPGPETSEQLRTQRFDLLLSLDKDAYTTSLAGVIDVDDRRGFGRDGNGSLVPLHPAARYAYDLGLSDELKFRQNDKTYQQITFEMCGLPWKKQEYDVPLSDALRERGRRVLEECAPSQSAAPCVGLNTGAGSVFANKAWTVDGYVELARRLHSEGCRVVLLGGPDERARNEEIARRAGGAAIDAGTNHTLPEFAGVVAACDLVVTGDTLGMHLAIAARVPVVVLFGSTCAQEIELYDRGEKIVTPIECHPCYRTACDITPSCQDRITVESVHEAVQRTLARIAGA